MGVRLGSGGISCTHSRHSSFDKVIIPKISNLIKFSKATNFICNKVDFSEMPKGYKTPKMINLKRVKARSSWMVTTITTVQNIV